MCFLYALEVHIAEPFFRLYNALFSTIVKQLGAPYEGAGSEQNHHWT